jgi:hypothetical protein
MGQRLAVESRREKESSVVIVKASYLGRDTVHTMLTRWLHERGMRGWHLHVASMASVGLCIGLWIRAKTVDQDERGNAERRALFVGLWPPTMWLIGDSLEKHD